MDLEAAPAFDLARLGSLRSVTLRQGLTQAWIAAIARAPGLEQVTLGDTPLAEELDLGPLVGLERLARLTLGAGFDPASVQRLRDARPGVVLQVAEG